VTISLPVPFGLSEGLILLSERILHVVFGLLFRFLVCFLPLLLLIETLVLVVGETSLRQNVRSDLKPNNIQQSIVQLVHINFHLLALIKLVAKVGSGLWDHDFVPKVVAFRVKLLISED